jgi:hypothetical protein
MKGILTRIGVSAGVVVVAQALTLGSAFAVPSEKQAWSSQKYGITVYHDDLDPKVFWFVPAIRFEASGGKTILSTRTLELRVVLDFRNVLSHEHAHLIRKVRRDPRRVFD